MNYITKIDDTAYERDPYKSLNKLFDHINLELLRYQYYNEEAADAKDLSVQLEATRKQLEETYEAIEFGKSFQDTKNYINQAKQNIRRSNRIADSLQTQMVSILGVFAAIIVAFFGGLSIFGSIFNNLNQKEFYRIGIMGSLVGLVFFDVIVFLLCAIGYFINKPLALANKLGSTKNFYKTCFKAINIILISMFFIFIALAIFQNCSGVPLM